MSHDPRPPLYAWWDGLVEPIQPGGIPTYGFLVKDGDTILHQESGLAGEPFTPEATSIVAEYMGLIHLLRWLVANAPDREVTIRGDNRTVYAQLTKNYEVESERLKPLAAEARSLFARLPLSRIAVVPREQNREADELTHRPYIEFIEKHPEVLPLLPLATERQLEALRRRGVPTYPYMGRLEARRLLLKEHARRLRNEDAPRTP